MKLSKIYRTSSKLNVPLENDICKKKVGSDFKYGFNGVRTPLKIDGKYFFESIKAASKICNEIKIAWAKYFFQCFQFISSGEIIGIVKIM